MRTVNGRSEEEQRLHREGLELYQITRGDLSAAGPSLDLLAAVGYVPSNGAIRDLTKRLMWSGCGIFTILDLKAISFGAQQRLGAEWWFPMGTR